MKIIIQSLKITVLIIVLVGGCGMLIGGAWLMNQYFGLFMLLFTIILLMNLVITDWEKHDNMNR